MVTMRSVNTETPAAAQKMSEYEKCREERIKENLERMKKLGILDLSLKLKTAVKPTRNNNNASSPVHKSPRRVSPMRHQGPVRRSSRYSLILTLLDSSTFFNVFWDYLHIFELLIGILPARSNFCRWFFY